MILKTIQKKAQLVVVSKYRSLEELLFYYEQGQRMFGENRVQELVAKYDALPKDIEWHMIGHLQSNKVKYIAPFIRLIHSVHAKSLLDEIDKQVYKHNRIISVCIQFNLAKEENKSGFQEAEWQEVMQYATSLSNVMVEGIMVMGPHTDDKQAIEQVFQKAQSLFEIMQKKYPTIRILSMGMSHDYELALKYKANLLRVGSILFES